ncbi:MAG: hypothetical protein Q9221_002526 [Calogaya cf. arnoldii]
MATGIWQPRDLYQSNRHSSTGGQVEQLRTLSSNPWESKFFNRFAASQNTYGLEQALMVDAVGYIATFQRESDYSETGYIFMDACPSSSSGPNCNASCNNTFGSMFESLPTLHNCFMFANMTDGGFEPAGKLHYLDEQRNATRDNVARVLDDCLSTYCDTLPHCSEKTKQYRDLPSLWSVTDVHAAGSSATRGQVLTKAICDNIPWRINSDVGGIGVYVSYWIQTGLAFLGLFGTILWKWIIPYGHLFYQAFKHGWNAAESRSQSLNRVAQKHLSRLIAALTDFHKAQCFFMLAINIAVLVVIQRGGFEPQSLQQIYDTYVFLQVLAVNGFLPITFTLTNLYLVGMLSWFLVLLSTVTVALSVATLASVGHFDPNETDMKSLATLAASGGPEECDGKQPGIYCMRTMGLNWGSPSFNGGHSDAYRTLGFCIANLVLLVGCQLQVKNLGIVRSVRHYFNTRLNGALRFVWILSKVAYRQIATRIPSHMSQAARNYWAQMSNLANLNNTPLVSASYRWCSVKTARLRSTRCWQFCLESASRIQQQQGKSRWQSLLKLALKIVIYIVFLRFYVEFYGIYLRDLAWFAENDVNGNIWDFGQVFAITVWVPPIVEYIHLEMRGMHRAFDHRLLPPFRISRTPAAEHGAEVSTMSISPITKSGEQHDLESGSSKDSPRPIELVTPISARSATPLSGSSKTSPRPVELVRPVSATSSTPSSSDDDNIGKANIITEGDDRVDDHDIGDQDPYTESNDHSIVQPDSIIPLRSYDSGDRDTERLLPPLDFKGDGTGFSSMAF